MRAELVKLGPDIAPLLVDSLDPGNLGNDVQEFRARQVAIVLEAEGTQNPVFIVNDPVLNSTSEQCRIDLTVTAPSWIRISIKDKAGDVTVGGFVSGVEVENASDAVEVYNVEGGVRVVQGGTRCEISECAKR